jgi:hypothetical protein
MNKITSKQGEKAFELHQTLVKLKEELSVRFLVFGKLLKELKENGYFEALGYDSFASYVTNSELGFKKSMAYSYIELYEWFIERLGYDFQRIGKMSLNEMSRVLYILKKELNESEKYPIKQLKARSDELISEVKDLRPVDFEKKYKDDQKQVGHEDYLAPPEYVRCDRCHKWKIIIPIQDCCDEWLDKMKQTLDKRKTTE